MNLGCAWAAASSTPLYVAFLRGQQIGWNRSAPRVGAQVQRCGVAPRLACNPACPMQSVDLRVM